MRPSVQAAFLDFTRPREGRIAYMYADVLGLVTTGIGNLIDSVPAALAAGMWRDALTKTVVGADAVAAEWHRIKDGRIPAWKKDFRLALSDADIDTLVLRRLLANETYLARRWAHWSDWPADAQLGAHSCAWAAGSGWRAPHFDAAAEKLDFDTIAGPPGDANADPTKRGEAWLRDEQEGVIFNPGLRPRNLANKLLFSNAAEVLRQGLDRDILHWPGSP